MNTNTVKNKRKKKRSNSWSSGSQKLSHEHSILTDQSLEDSMLAEYWNDFNHENWLKAEKKNYKFLDLDDPFAAAFQKENKDFEKLRKKFDPNNPPLLVNYDILHKDYKLPSKLLLKMEKEEYRKYIKRLRDVTKILVRRAKTQSKIAARKYIIEKIEDYRKRIEKESFYLNQAFIKMRSEVEEKEKYIIKWEHKFKTQEEMLTYTSILLSNAGIDYFDFERKQKKIQAEKGNYKFLKVNIERKQKESRNKLSLLRGSSIKWEWEDKYSGINYTMALCKPFSLYSFQAPLLNQCFEVSQAERLQYLVEENQKMKERIHKYEESFSKCELV